MSRYMPHPATDPPGSPKLKPFSSRRRTTSNPAFKLVPSQLRSSKSFPVYLGGLVLFTLLTLYSSGLLSSLSLSSSSPSLLSPETREATQSARHSALQSRNLLTDADSLTYSDTLPQHLRTLDASLRNVFSTHRVLKDHEYKPTVYSATLTPAQQQRYAHLRPPSPTSVSQGGMKQQKKWLFTSVLLNVAGIAPDMFAALAVATDWLGAENVGLSVVEGPSEDGTDELFETVLAPMMVKMGVDPRDMHLNTRRPGVNFANNNRIEMLAKLREEAVLPLRRRRGGSNDDRAYEASVFFNDVYFSGAQLLEMIHQHTTQSAHMTCAWDLLWGNDYFYDTWVFRDIHTGDLVHEMGETWQPLGEAEIFKNSPKTRERYRRGMPFQAAGCWNGISLLSTSLLHPPPTSSNPPEPIHFRRSNRDSEECAAAEVSLLTQDMWARTKGHAKILVVPGVKLGYERHVAEGARDIGLEVEAEWEEGGGGTGVRVGRGGEGVKWVGPPKKIRCHPWPEINGTGGVNVWETTRWVDPLMGM